MDRYWLRRGTDQVVCHGCWLQENGEFQEVLFPVHVSTATPEAIWTGSQEDAQRIAQWFRTSFSIELTLETCPPVLLKASEGFISYNFTYQLQGERLSTEGSSPVFSLEQIFKDFALLRQAFSYSDDELLEKKILLESVYLGPVWTDEWCVCQERKQLRVSELMEYSFIKVNSEQIKSLDHSKYTVLGKFGEIFVHVRRLLISNVGNYNEQAFLDKVARVVRNEIMLIFSMSLYKLLKRANSGIT